jgi:hypothetical protein
MDWSGARVSATHPFWRLSAAAHRVKAWEAEEADLPDIGRATAGVVEYCTCRRVAYASGYSCSGNLRVHISYRHMYLRYHIDMYTPKQYGASQRGGQRVTIDWYWPREVQHGSLQMSWLISSCPFRLPAAHYSSRPSRCIGVWTASMWSVCR